jgi:mono/diheme cytochrome c family protein
MNPLTRRRRQLFATLALMIATQALAVHAAAPRFDRDVEPILSEHCFACHGPGKQEAGLRLDSLDAASRPLDSGHRAIVAGDAAASELVARIVATDPDVLMPPPHANKPLSAAQRDTLRSWIESGAHYEQHWSFRPLRRPALPDGAAEAGPIDRFLETRLAAEALPVNAEADRETLIRRATFALTGLPPKPAEVDAFLADNAPHAYERLVDRLLASPHHGEEMARHWLDVARYADTHGLHLDNEREMWGYRDWVVKAFNDNLPFDRFTIEQIAGDLLPAATRDQQVATGFSRCNVTTSEGGSINDELLFRYAVDRTATMTNAWMGLTGQCAVCHDHKFDPLSAREFYSLYAFFNSAADPGFDGNVLRTVPVIRLATPEQEAQLAELDSRRRAAEAGLEAAIAQAAYVDPASVTPPPSRRDVVWIDDAFPAGADARSGLGAATSWLTSQNPGEVFSGQRCLERTATGIGQDFYAGGAEPIAVPAGAELFAQVWLDPVNPPRAVMLEFRTSDWKHRAVWGDWTAVHVTDGRTDKPEFFHVGPLPEAGRWMRVAVPVEKVGLAGQKLTGIGFVQAFGHVRWDRLGISVPDDSATNPARSLAAWWKERTGKDKLDDVPEPLRKIVKQGPEKTTDQAEADRVRRHWLTKVWAEPPAALAAAAREFEAVEKVSRDLGTAIPNTLVFKDLPAMRDSFVMQRGAYDKPGEKVTRGTPAFLPPLVAADAAAPSRLDLAKWLVSAEHPLTARVAANRLWQQLFGVGLVKTSEDFGLQGEPPSHPELLDWLAAEYRDAGWDTRKLVRMIVTSRAFRRASAAAEPQLARDPENRLLARGPRIRLDAEQIRDNALAVSGLLVPRLGGRGVKPYQPDNIWEPVGFNSSNTRYYTRDAGESLYRRSLYTFLKRTAPPPFMANFDAPNREQFCARRDRSNTPLQALQLMNDVQHVEAARGLAARVLAEASGDDAGRIEWLYRTVLARRPQSAEAAVVAESLAGHRKRYAADPDAARKLVAYGDSKPPDSLPVDELAAWTLVANMLLNLDETLTRN